MDLIGNSETSWKIPAFPPGQKCSAWTHSEKIGPNTGSVSANFPHPVFHPCVSTLPLEGPSLELRLQKASGQRSQLFLPNEWTVEEKA
ncbi:hypothetical protein E5288_WYG015680 [Bos mutus]|uniref:Uncharacterized protein n=1 Tax=Bos mutus TaxID=72004 RepID=A0A6B0S0P6_9CETA|nr:hypothetical protein [Bos mutus]